MSINANAVATDWNNQRSVAIGELDTLEVTLKADYNKYIDSLSAYLQRLKAANDIRNNYINDLSIEDIKNDTRNRETFLYSAADPIKNNAKDYMLDDHRNSEVTKASLLIESCSIDALINMKVL